MQNLEKCRTVGRLMSPYEVYAATLSDDELPTELKHNWFLCGDIPGKIWDAIMGEAEPIGFRISTFTTPTKTAFCCFTIQAGDSQVRFLLPLEGKKMTWFLKEASFCGVYIAAARQNSERAVVKRFGGNPADIGPVLAVLQHCVEIDPLTRITEMALAYVELSQASAIPSTFDNVTVNDVHVVAILPDINDDEPVQH